MNLLAQLATRGSDSLLERHALDPGIVHTQASDKAATKNEVACEPAAGVPDAAAESSTGPAAAATVVSSTGFAAAATAAARVPAPGLLETAADSSSHPGAGTSASFAVEVVCEPAAGVADTAAKSSSGPAAACPAVVSSSGPVTVAHAEQSEERACRLGRQIAPALKTTRSGSSSAASPAVVSSSGPVTVPPTVLPHAGPPLPPGWVQVQHKEGFYYWNTVTHEVSWKPPAGPQPAAASKPQTSVMSKGKSYRFKDWRR